MAASHNSSQDSSPYLLDDLNNSRRSKRLSTNEKKVLYGLVKYPLDNDRELALKLNFKMSTLTAIKNRLKKPKLNLKK